MALTAGDKLGPYEILSLIGKGGMGEVYRAHDSRTGRDVAVKVSTERFTERFGREVQAVAALNHPNICSLFDVGPNYLVMEFVEGESPKGPLQLEEVLGIVRQIAEALAAAHEKGIVHRDLKPANIKIRPDGTVKVLDFGLAKVAPVKPGDAENSPTLSMAATQAGVILGTAAYMPPEQAKGKVVDHRADIWAFGVVFYELLTGKRLFQGEDVTDTLAAVVMKEADLSAVPVQHRRLIEACLRKDPRRRLQAIGDWQLLLGETAAEAAPSAKTSSAFAWIAAAVAAIAILGLGYVGYRHYTEEPARLLSLSITAPEKTAFAGTDVPAISPDGRHVAFTLTGQPGLWVRDLDSSSVRQLSTSEGARMPFWSPNSRSIGFFANAKLKRIELTGGPEQTLADATIGNGGTWNRDNVIVYSPAFGNLFRISATGGTTSPVTQGAPNEIFEVAPQFLPDGKRFLYASVSSDSTKQGVYLADLTGTPRRQILAQPTNAAYVLPGYLLYLRGGTLMAQPFDAGKAELSGEAVPIAESIAGSGSSLGLFSASNEGKVVFTSGQSGGAQLKWFDRSGKSSGTVGPPGSIMWAWLSPDETTVVDARTDETGKPDIWLHDVQHGTDSRLTLGQQTSTFPVWSPDSNHVAFFSVIASGPAIVQKATKGPGELQILDADPAIKRPTDWSRDGRYIVEDRPNNPKTGVDVWILPLTGPAGSQPKAYPYLNESYNEGDSRISPNGQWLAYQSDATRRSEIYVVTFPNKGGQWQVSVNGGSLPVWSRDGKELFFLSPDQKMMAVEIRGGPNFDRGTPKALFDARLGGPAWFDVSKDGRFLLPVPGGDSTGGPLTVLINWTEKLKR